MDANISDEDKPLGFLRSASNASVQNAFWIIRNSIVLTPAEDRLRLLLNEIENLSFQLTQSSSSFY